MSGSRGGSSATRGAAPPMSGSRGGSSTTRGAAPPASGAWCCCCCARAPAAASAAGAAAASAAGGSGGGMTGSTTSSCCLLAWKRAVPLVPSTCREGRQRGGQGGRIAGAAACEWQHHGPPWTLLPDGRNRTSPHLVGQLCVQAVSSGHAHQQLPASCFQFHCSCAADARQLYPQDQLQRAAAQLQAAPCIAPGCAPVHLQHRSRNLRGSCSPHDPSHSRSCHRACQRLGAAHSARAPPQPASPRRDAPAGIRVPPLQAAQRWCWRQGQAAPPLWARAWAGWV